MAQLLCVMTLAARAGRCGRHCSVAWRSAALWRGTMLAAVLSELVTARPLLPTSAQVGEADPDIFFTDRPRRTPGQVRACTRVREPAHWPPTRVPPALPWPQTVAAVQTPCSAPLGPCSALPSLRVREHRAPHLLPAPQRNRECLTLFADEEPGLLKGRSPLQCYADFMRRGLSLGGGRRRPRVLHRSGRAVSGCSRIARP